MVAEGVSADGLFATGHNQTATGGLFVDGQVAIIRLGCVDYAEGLRWQNFLHQSVKQKKLAGALLLLEHSRVLTLGKNSSSENILVSEETLKNLGVELMKTDRGGDVTAHEPGQLVVYPIFYLQSGVKAFVATLLESVLALLRIYDIEGKIVEKRPGVWVDDKKICAVGIRVDQHITKHGIALNISNSLESFSLIMPCGLKNFGVASMKQMSPRSFSVDDVCGNFIGIFCDFFKLLKHNVRLYTNPRMEMISYDP